MQKEQERNQHDQPEEQQFGLSRAHNLKFLLRQCASNEAFTLPKCTFHGSIWQLALAPLPNSARPEP